MLIEWNKVPPDEFEEFCFQLLGELGFQNRKLYKGPGDKGRDITATTTTEDIPGKPQTIEWIIECKRKTTGALGVSDISESFEKAMAHSPDKYLIITTSYLTVDTKDWLKNKTIRERINFEIIELIELEDLIMKFTTPIGSKILSHYLGTSTAIPQALAYGFFGFYAIT